MPDNRHNAVPVPKFLPALCTKCLHPDSMLVPVAGVHSGYLRCTLCGKLSSIYYIDTDASQEKIRLTIAEELLSNPPIDDVRTDPIIGGM